MGRRYETVSFLSDYGTTDEFVGVVHSVIRDLAPHARIIDLTHGVPAFDVRAGSLALARCIGYVASGVVLAVVDPGVGTDRLPIGLRVARGGGRAGRRHRADLVDDALHLFGIGGRIGGLQGVRAHGLNEGLPKRVGGLETLLRRFGQRLGHHRSIQRA